MSDKAIEVCKLSKDYRLYTSPRDRLLQLLTGRDKSIKVRALNGVTFSVKRGEVVGILGRNGAGKSTLLKVLTHVLPASAGSVQVRGRISAILELGVGINPEYSGRDNAKLGSLARGVDPRHLDKIVSKIIDFSELGDVINRPLKSYSSGMQARLLFSTAIMAEADVMIIDEALAAGDALFQEKCLLHMKDIASSGVTVLFVSHSIDMVQQLCNRALVLQDGRLICDSDVSTATHEYHELLARERSQQNNAEQVILNRSDGPIDKSDKHDYNIGYIESLLLLDKKGQTVSELIAGQRYSCIITLHAVKHIESVYVGFRIYLPSGLVLFATSNTMLGTRLELKSGETSTITFTFKCLLQTGVYLLGCGLGKLVDSNNRLYPAPFLPIHICNGIATVSVRAENNFGGLCDLSAEVTKEGL